MGTRTGVDDMEKIKFLPLPGLKLQPLGRPARSQPLYRMSYPGSNYLSHVHHVNRTSFQQQETKKNMAS
jgi:hypothetical protein